MTQETKHDALVAVTQAYIRSINATPKSFWSCFTYVARVAELFEADNAEKFLAAREIARRFNVRMPTGLHLSWRDKCPDPSTN